MSSSWVMAMEAKGKNMKFYYYYRVVSEVPRDVDWPPLMAMTVAMKWRVVSGEVGAFVWLWQVMSSSWMMVTATEGKNWKKCGYLVDLETADCDE